MTYDQLVPLAHRANAAEAELEKVRDFNRSQNYAHTEYVLSAWRTWREAVKDYERALATFIKEEQQ